MDLLALIPGYKAAVEEEQLLRDAAFLPVNEEVCGFTLRPMTLRDYLILRLAKNPLLIGGTPKPGDLTDFLWLLSPSYRPGYSLSKWWLKRRVRNRFLAPAPPLLFLRQKRRRARAIKRWEADAAKRLLQAAKTVEGIRAFVRDTLLDLPESTSSSSSGYKADYYSDGTAMCGKLGREYGWPEEHTLNMPMRRLLQYLNEICCASGNRVAVTNPSDKVKLAWQTAQNQKAA